MDVCSFTLRGYEGLLVKVETDLRRGLPGTEIIGLPDGAVKEAKERVRVAIRNSGFEFPKERILINLTPAGVKKEGSAFDLAMAVALLFASNQIDRPENDMPGQTLILGELELSGRARGVNGALSAIAGALDQGATHFIVAPENACEAEAVIPGKFRVAASLKEASDAFSKILHGENAPGAHLPAKIASRPRPPVDFRDIKGQPTVKRALEVAASGRHNLFLFGPPGCGKTMACRALQGVLPPLTEEERLETARVYSIKGMLTDGLPAYPPFRTPHHSASAEGIIGGGKNVSPGEASLAHNGVLFLDEAPEFGKDLLQNLREPMESKRVTIARAGTTVWYPANFQLILAANVCPCGALGRSDKACMCGQHEISRYWKRIGAAILDRVDIRLPVEPVPTETLLTYEEESSEHAYARVEAAVDRQKFRYKGLAIRRNGELESAHMESHCALSDKAEQAFLIACKRLNLSSRAGHGILRVARTIADLEGSDDILPAHALEAAGYRRYGDNDLYWTEI